ncbi:MAG: nitroreductase family protein [Bacillota bacterium]
MDLIMSRKSIRIYSSQPVADEVIKDLLKAAMSAPSAGNQQPWHFIVISDREILDAIPNFHPYSYMLGGAKVTILVCGDERLEIIKGYWVQDCSAATQNILIEAHAKGLGAVWLGIYPIKERIEGFRKLLNLPEQVVPLSLIPIGYPEEQVEVADQYKEDRVHYNRW